MDMIKNTLKDGLKEFKLVINHSQVDRSNEIWVFPNFAAQFLFPKEGSKSKYFLDPASLLLTGIPENAFSFLPERRLVRQTMQNLKICFNAVQKKCKELASEFCFI